MVNVITNIIVTFMLMNLMLYFHRMFVCFDKRFRALEGTLSGLLKIHETHITQLLAHLELLQGTEELRVRDK